MSFNPFDPRQAVEERIGEAVQEAWQNAEALMGVDITPRPVDFGIKDAELENMSIPERNALLEALNAAFQAARGDDHVW